MNKGILRMAWVLCTIAVLASCGIQQTDTQGYVLAFAEKGSSQIRVRWSKDGNNWENSEFRNETTKGIGGAGDINGLVRIIPWTTTNDHLQFAWGIGDIFDQIASETTSQSATSAPSAVYASAEGSWIIAYRTTGNVISVRIFDQKSSKFLDVNCAPLEDAANDYVNGRPALARLGNTIVMAWARQVTPQDASTIRVAVGNVSQAGCPVWNSKYGFPLAEIEGRPHGALASDPTLTHDQHSFYLGYNRNTRCSGEDCLNAADFFLHASADGITWGDPITLYQIPSPYYSYVNIAGRSDGSILAAFVGNGPFEVHRWKDGSWTEMDASSVFGLNPEYSQFALVSVGRPPVVTPTP